MNRRILQILWCICLVFSSHAYAQDNLSALIPMPNKVATSSKAPLVLQGDKVACYIQVDSLQFELKTVASLFQKIRFEGRADPDKCRCANSFVD